MISFDFTTGSKNLRQNPFGFTVNLIEIIAIILDAKTITLWL